MLRGYCREAASRTNPRSSAVALVGDRSCIDVSGRVPVQERGLRGSSSRQVAAFVVPEKQVETDSGSLAVGWKRSWGVA